MIYYKVETQVQFRFCISDNKKIWKSVSIKWGVLNIICSLETRRANDVTQSQRDIKVTWNEKRTL